MNLRSMFIVILTLVTLGMVCVAQQAGQVQVQNGLASYTVPRQQPQLDFANAKPMPLPAVSFAPQDYGLTNHPFTTERADLSGATNKLYPYRATGKLFFLIGSQTYMCSASLIKKGVVVTAAHCVANYGQNQWYTGWQFIPGYRNGVAPYGIQTAYQAWVMSQLPKRQRQLLCLRRYLSRRRCRHHPELHAGHKSLCGKENRHL